MTTILIFRNKCCNQAIAQLCAVYSPRSGDFERNGDISSTVICFLTPFHAASPEPFFYQHS
jgi:hypothetical protein